MKRIDQPTQQPSPRDVYTYAAAVAHCPTHRAQHEEFEAQAAARVSRPGRDRQLDLPFSRRTPAVSQ